MSKRRTKFRLTALALSVVGLGSPAVSSADSGTLQFSAAAFETSEESDYVAIEVTRTGGSDGTVSVDCSTSAGTATAGVDYTELSNLTLSWGEQDSDPKSCTVSIIDDSNHEGAETVNLALSNPTNASLGSPDTTILTIEDNSILQFSMASFEVPEEGGNATIEVTRTDGSDGTVSVDCSTSAGTATTGVDYTELSNLTLSWGDQDSDPKNCTVSIIDDSDHEGTETVNLALSNPTNDASLGTPDAATLTIEDNSILQFSRTSTTINEGGSQNEDGSQKGLLVPFWVSRTGGCDGLVTVDYETSNGTAIAPDDYIAKNGTLSWNEDECSTVEEKIDLVDDNDNNEGDETFTITLSNPTGGASLGIRNKNTITIEDNCGGEHWIDDCPAGTDNMTNTTADMTVKIPCDASPGITVTSTGPTLVYRSAGQNAVSPHSIDTEIVSMVLTGNGLTVRAGVDEGLALRSLGTIEELSSNANIGESTFNIYFEISNGENTWHNKDGEPMSVRTQIGKVPPFDSLYEYKNSDSIKLYNEDESMAEGCLIHAEHQVLYEIATPSTPGGVSTLLTFVDFVDDSFTATTTNNETVTVTWETATEIDNAGFFVWRGQLSAGETVCSKDGKDYVEVKKISPFIPAQGSGSSYSYSDNQVAPGNTYCYVLEDIDLMDRHTFHLYDIPSASVQ